MPMLVPAIYINASSNPYMHTPFGLAHNQRRNSQAVLPFCNWYNHRFQLLGSGELSLDDIEAIARDISDYECMFISFSELAGGPSSELDNYFFRRVVACIRRSRVGINGWYFYNLEMLSLRQSTLTTERLSLNDLHRVCKDLQELN